MERSVAEFSLDEPFDTPHGEEAVGGVSSDIAHPKSGQSADLERICANPLREEPAPIIVGAVRRFGIVGLVACALGAGLLRWWRSLLH